MDRAKGGSVDRFQVRLWDLIVVVVGAAYVLDVARRSGVGWGAGLPDLDHATGLAVLTLGVAVGLVLAGQWARRLRAPGGRAWATIWRVPAVAWLAGSMVEVAAALQDLSAPPAPGLFSTGPLRLRLTTLMAALGMVGLVLASAPPGRRSAGPVRAGRGRGSWPSVLLATVGGLAILGLGHGLYPYLVLLALEFVHNALRMAPPVPRPAVLDRLVMAALEALPGLVGCLLTAIWVDDDLRGASRDPLGERSQRSWWGVLARSATVALAAAGAARVAFVSIPRLSPMMVEGLAMVVRPSMIATVALGFVALAAGFAASGAARLSAGPAPADGPTAPRPSLLQKLGPWPRRVVGGLAGLACLEVAASAMQVIVGDTEVRWYIVRIDGWDTLAAPPAGWFGYPSGGSALREVFDRPDEWLIAIAAGWLTVRLAILVGSKHPGGTPPMDAIAADRLAFGRFFGWWIALATAMLGSMPGLAIVAITLLHFAVRWLTR